MVGVISLEFKGEKGKDPDTSFKMKVMADVIHPTSGTRIHGNLFEYSSEEHELSDWIENNGKLLKKEFENCYHNIAERIIKKNILIQ